MAKTNYNAEDIKIIEGLDAVRLRPGMYIGTTSSKGLHHILWEIVDNAVDEAANGFANRVEVKLYKDGSASVEDNGRGIPTDVHSKAGVSGVQVVFTQLHAGGKFDSDNYNFSGGLHGVGASVTNALSEWLKVEVYKKTVYSMEFHSYLDKESGKIKSGVPVAPLKDTKVKTNKKGTFVRFMPDKRVFETVEFSVETILKRLKEIAFLNKVQRGDILLQDDLNQLHQRGDDQNEDDGLHIAQVVGVEQVVLDGPGNSGCKEHNEDNCDGHTRCLIQLLGNTEEGADTKELGENVVINQSSSKDYCNNFFHSATTSFFSSEQPAQLILPQAAAEGQFSQPNSLFLGLCLENLLTAAMRMPYTAKPPGAMVMMPMLFPIHVFPLLSSIKQVVCPLIISFCRNLMS